jgi:LPXTG-motif cell wall-anchored protein
VLTQTADLAHTGANAGAIVGIAVGLLAAGATLLVIASKRRKA